MSPVLVIPTGTVTGQVVNSLGQPVSGLPVVAKLNAGVSTPQTISPVGQQVPGEVTAFTDSTGAWSLSLVANNNINPANSTYTIQIPGFPDVFIQLNDTASHVYTAIAVNPTTAILAPAGQTVAQLTVTGELDVTGPAAFHGPDPWFDVKHPAFGAKGDGVTDDTAAIQAALTAAGKNPVWFPPGNYICTGVLTPGGPGQVWAGAGGRSGGSATASMLTYTPSTGARFIDARDSSGFQMRDLFVLCSNASFAGVAVDVGFTATGASYCEIRNCTIDLIATATGIAVNFDRITSSAIKGCLITGGITELQLSTSGAANGVALGNVKFNYVSGGSCIAGSVNGMACEAVTIEFNSLTVNSTAINLGANSSGVTFIGCQSADAGAGSTGSVLSMAGNALSVLGCTWGGVVGMIAINVVSGAIGQAILGNQFSGFTNAAFLGAVSGPLLYAGNWPVNVTTEIGGTGPSKGSVVLTSAGNADGTVQWTRIHHVHARSTESFSATPTPNVRTGEWHQYTLTGNVTSVNAPTNALPGDEITFMWVQDGTGGRTVAFAAAYHTTGRPAMVTTANTVTWDTFRTYDGSTWFWQSGATGQ